MRYFCIVALALFPAIVYAAEFAGAPSLPESFLKSVSPAISEIGVSQIEKPQAVDGSTSMVVAPIYRGENNTTSFLRLANPTSTAATYTIRLVGTPNGTLLGTAIYSVPAFASPQYSSGEIEAKAGVTSLGSEAGYSLYLASSNSTSGFQHVIFNSSNRFFENLSVCSWGSATNYTALNRTVVNAHTSLFAAFPAVVSIHNSSATAGNYRVSVYEAASGTKKGSYDFSVVANGTYVTPVSFFQDQVQWTPAGSEFHANFVFEPLGSTTYSLVVGDAISNVAQGTVINMTQICALNSGAVPTGGGGSTVVTTTSLTSQIMGNFNGWSGSTVFPLTNGQIWQQSSYAYHYAFAFQPDVVIFSYLGGYRMIVEGETTWLAVQRIQ